MLLLTAAAANAQQVSQQEALRKATAFFNKEQLPTIKQKALLAYQATKSAASQTTGDDAYYYIFNRGETIRDLSLSVVMNAATIFWDGAIMELLIRIKYRVTSNTFSGSMNVRLGMYRSTTCNLM